MVINFTVLECKNFAAFLLGVFQCSTGIY